MRHQTYQTYQTWKIAAMLVVAAVAAAGHVDALQAQTGFTRKTLLDQDLSLPGRHAVVLQGDFPAGAATGRHTHPGDELGYVLEGAIVLQIEGHPPMTYRAGETFFVPAGVVHSASNAGPGSARAVVTYIVEKGKPIVAPVQP